LFDAPKDVSRINTLLRQGDEAHVVEAVCRCWEAAWSDSVVLREDASLQGSDVGLSLIVQQFISG
jgi:hypothetical protein